MVAVAAIVWVEWASSCQAETLEISILLLPRAALMLGKHKQRQTPAVPQSPIILDESGFAGG